jgi:hypothetical protein
MRDGRGALLQDDDITPALYSARSMEPIIFLEEVVYPNVADQGANASELRHAFNAIAAVDTLAACMFHWCRAHWAAVDCLDDTSYRNNLAHRSDDFGLIRDLANAQKHVELTRTPVPTSDSQLVRRASALRTNVHGSPCLVVKLDNGDLKTISDVIAGALDFLEAEMERMGM